MSNKEEIANKHCVIALLPSQEPRGGWEFLEILYYKLIGTE